MEQIVTTAKGWIALLVFVCVIVGCGSEGRSSATVTEDATAPVAGDSTAGDLVAEEVGTAGAPTSSPMPTVVLLATPSSIVEPTEPFSATPPPTETATNTPEPDETPTPTPTLGPRVTRTPVPPGLCPSPSDDLPAIVPITPGTGIVEGFEPQILAFLNAGGAPESLREVLSELSLTDDGGIVWRAWAQAVAVDVTGNTTADVVVSLSFAVEGQYADGALFVFSCQDQAYQGGLVTPLGGQLLSIGGPDPGIRVIQDMNANGVAEIVLSYIEVIGTHSNYTRLFRILEWDGSQFVDLVQSDSVPSDTAAVQNGDGAVYDTNGNRNLELVLTNGVGQGYEDGGPQRERTEFWTWNGYAFRLARSEYEPPVYRFQAVQDGDDSALAGRFEQALDFYEQAIFDDGLLGWSQGQFWPEAAHADTPTPTPDPDERSRLSAYALYRTMLVHVLTDAMEDAQIAFEELQGQFPEGISGHQYAELAKAFWEEYSARADVGRACVRAAEYADAHTDEVLVPLGSSYYGYLNRNLTAQDVCPFED